MKAFFPLPDDEALVGNTNIGTSPGTLANNLTQTSIEDAASTAAGGAMQGEQPLLLKLHFLFDIQGDLSGCYLGLLAVCR